MRNPAVLCLLAAVLGTGGCGLTPRPQNGGGSTTTLGGATGPTVITTTAPQNAQTPTTTTVEKTTTREFPPVASGQRVASSESVTGPAVTTAPSRDLGPSPARYPLPIREVITERATTQTGTSQDLAGILKVWGSATAAHYKALLWALVLGVAAWSAWRREWPLIAAVLGVGAVLSLLVAWWVGSVAAGAAALVWAAYHVARANLRFRP